MQLRQPFVTGMTVIAFAATVIAQELRHNISALLSSVEYDARQFLSAAERNTFRKLYASFDKPRVGKNWEWQDVDPVGLFSAEENRRRRRDAFLFEYSSSTRPNEESPTNEQQGSRIRTREGQAPNTLPT